MAICTSHLFAGMRGSIAGVTYFTTGAGQIIARQRTNPVNPQSNKQTQIRNRFATAAYAWEAMSDSNRSLWNDYADSLGTGQTGRSVFIANYTLAAHANDIEPAICTLTSNPPTSPGVLPIDAVAIGTYMGPGTGIAVDVSSMYAEDIAVLIQRSRQFSTARNTFQGPFDPDTNVAELLAAPASVHYEFDDLVAGGVYFFRVNAVQCADFHIKSADYILRGVAVTVAP